MPEVDKIVSWAASEGGVKYLPSYGLDKYDKYISTWLTVKDFE